MQIGICMYWVTNNLYLSRRLKNECLFEMLLQRKFYKHDGAQKQRKSLAQLHSIGGTFVSVLWVSEPTKCDCIFSLTCALL